MFKICTVLFIVSLIMTILISITPTHNQIIVQEYTNNFNSFQSSYDNNSAYRFLTNCKELLSDLSYDDQGKGANDYIKQNVLKANLNITNTLNDFKTHTLKNKSDYYNLRIIKNRFLTNNNFDTNILLELERSKKLVWVLFSTTLSFLFLSLNMLNKNFENSSDQNLD